MERHYGLYSSFVDIHKCNCGDPQIFMDLHNLIVDIQLFMEIHNSFMEMHNSFVDLQLFMDIYNCIYGYPQLHLWIPTI